MPTAPTPRTSAIATSCTSTTRATRIEHYGGIVEKYIGDAVMAVFGTPLAKADDAERAVRAALSIIEGVHELNLEHPGLDLELRGAVCTGEAVVAIDAAPGEPLATGDVANTAARLQNAAPPGGVLIGRQTYELVRHSFELTELEPIRAKGKREPVRAWRVLAPLDAPGARPVPAPRWSVATTSSRSSPASGTEPSTRPGRIS